MELTPELLALLQDLFELCERETERAREAEQTQKQIERIAFRVRAILESMK